VSYRPAKNSALRSLVASVVTHCLVFGVWNALFVSFQKFTGLCLTHERFVLQEDGLTRMRRAAVGG